MLLLFFHIIQNIYKQHCNNHLVLYYASKHKLTNIQAGLIENSFTEHTV